MKLMFQGSLTETIVRYSFYKKFKPKPLHKLFIHFHVLKKSWDLHGSYGLDCSRTNIEWLDEIMDKLAKNPDLNLLKELLKEVSNWLRMKTEKEQHYKEVLALKDILEETLLRVSDLYKIEQRSSF